MRCDGYAARWVATMVFAGLCMSAAAQSQMMPMPGKFVSVSSPASLAPTRKLSCIDLSSIKNTYTPPDIYTAIRACLGKGDYDRAAMLFPLAGAYAHFDTLRITDQTARDGGQVLIVQTSATMTPDQKQTFKEAITRVMSDPKKHADFCSDVHKIGPPDYFPKYLIMHGMNALSASHPEQNALVPNFDAQGTWATLQTQYLQCAD
jgi:hypothetical protein